MEEFAPEGASINGFCAAGTEREDPIRYQPVGSVTLPFLGGTSSCLVESRAARCGPSYLVQRSQSMLALSCPALGCLLRLRSSFSAYSTHRLQTRQITRSLRRQFPFCRTRTSSGLHIIKPLNTFNCQRNRLLDPLPRAQSDSRRIYSRSAHLLH